MVMKALKHSTRTKAKKSGRYRSVDDAVQQKQAALLTVLAGADLTRFTGQIDGGNINPGNGQGQPAGDNVSDVPYEEVK